MPSNSAWRKPSSNCAAARERQRRHQGPAAGQRKRRTRRLLDDAARQFAEAVGGAEGSEGTLAFVQKRKPVWAQ
ncbi:enoyl-CoA hydratase/isomerase [Pseudomonas aeruginosa]|nr:enoyl-CoA hydratase/isomerase [Pseudomonas aeruginosa]